MHYFNQVIKIEVTTNKRDRHVPSNIMLWGAPKFVYMDFLPVHITKINHEEYSNKPKLNNARNKCSLLFRVKGMESKKA